MTTRHLGATYVEYSILTSDWDEQHGFLQSGSIYIEASLKPSLCSAQDLGARGIILLSKNYFQIWINPASPIIMTLCLQPGVINNHEPALATIMTRNYQLL